MSARKAPRWTAAEVATLREHYPRGGLPAVIALLPDRSWHSIHVKASKLGIKCEQPDYGSRKCRVQGDHLEEAIRLREVEKWGFGRIGAHLGYCETTVTNAVIIAQSHRQGFTPAARHSNGRLTGESLDRLRWMLRKGLKGVEIQLRLGVSAACVAEQRRRYNADLKARGKALLPPPGGGAAYSGVKVPAAKKREAEALFLDGFGTRKVSDQSGVSKTVCTRLRNRLIARLKRKGEALPGCDLDGKRQVVRGHARAIPDVLVAKLRGLILARVPVRRAALICGIGGCSAYRIRDAMKAELGEAFPRPLMPGRVSPLASEMLAAQAIPDKHLWRFRQLVHQHGDPDEARRLLRAELAERKRNRTFEEQLADVASGASTISTVQRIRTADPSMTLGGVTAEAI